MTDIHENGRTRHRRAAKPGTATASGDDVLGALHDYIEAEVEMRTRSRIAMGLNMTDMSAVRRLVEAQASGELVSPKDLAAHLNISTASVSVLLDRLEKSGHIERTNNPNDGRGFLIVPTQHAVDNLADTMGGMSSRVERAIATMSAADANVVVDFLHRVRDAVDASVRTS